MKYVIGLDKVPCLVVEITNIYNKLYTKVYHYVTKSISINGEKN